MPLEISLLKLETFVRPTLLVVYKSNVCQL